GEADGRLLRRRSAAGGEEQGHEGDSGEAHTPGTPRGRKRSLARVLREPERVLLADVGLEPEGAAAALPHEHVAGEPERLLVLRAVALGRDDRVRRAAEPHARR